MSSSAAPNEPHGIGISFNFIGLFSGSGEAFKYSSTWACSIHSGFVVADALIFTLQSHFASSFLCGTVHYLWPHLTPILFFVLGICCESVKRASENNSAVWRNNPHIKSYHGRHDACFGCWCTYTISLAVWGKRKGIIYL